MVREAGRTNGIFFGLVTRDHLVQVDPVKKSATFWVTDKFSTGL